MLEQLGFSDAASLKRFFVMLLAPLFALLVGRFGIAVPESVQDAVLGVLAVFIWSSAHKAAVVATAQGALAASKVDSLEAAKAVLTGDAKPTPVETKAVQP